MAFHHVLCGTYQRFLATRTGPHQRVGIRFPAHSNRPELFWIDTSNDLTSIQMGTGVVAVTVLRETGVRYKLRDLVPQGEEHPEYYFSWELDHHTYPTNLCLQYLAGLTRRQVSPDLRGPLVVDRLWDYGMARNGVAITFGRTTVDFARVEDAEDMTPTDLRRVVDLLIDGRGHDLIAQEDWAE